MDTQEIYDRYERNLMHIGAASDAVRLALRMAIEETATIVKTKYRAHLDSLDTWLLHSGQRIDGYGVVDSAINTLTTLNERNAAQADMITSLRTELSKAIDERNVADAACSALRQQLAQMDAELQASQKMTISAHDEAKANAKDAYALRQQLMQVDADNADLLHELQKAGVTAPGKVSVEAVAKKLEGGN